MNNEENNENNEYIENNSVKSNISDEEQSVVEEFHIDDNDVLNTVPNNTPVNTSVNIPDNTSVNIQDNAQDNAIIENKDWYSQKEYIM